MQLLFGRSSVILFICFCVTGSCCDVNAAEADEISVDRLRGHVFFLASDYLAGRVTGTEGYRIAAEYAASQFAAIGLKPILPDCEGRGGFLQPVAIPMPNGFLDTATDTLHHNASNPAGGCYNIIGCVPGTNLALAREYVLVCAHLDHIPPISGEICNGADDNGSGCAAVLEIASLVAKAPLERSVIFALFTGEDYSARPRLGSRYFLDHWPNERGRIFMNVNLDMIGREDTTWPKPQGITVMDSESVCPELREVCEMANEKGNRLPLHYDVSQGGASDNHTFAEAGIPSLGLFTGAHPDLHRPSDEVDRLSFHRIQQIAGLALVLIHELASGKTDLCR